MIDIYIKSYHKDFKFLRYCLKSIAKFATGYNKIILAIPNNEINMLWNTIGEELKTLNISVVPLAEYGDGYLYQQWCKMSANQISDAEFIMYVDSDCIFHFPIDLQTLIKDGKSELLYTHYSKVGDAICWQQCTESILNKKVEYEFMRRNGLIFKKSTLDNIAKEYPDLERQIMLSARFSEFNMLGAYAFFNELDQYNFINTDDWKYTEPVVRQYWSWGGIEKVEAEINQLLTQ